MSVTGWQLSFERVTLTNIDILNPERQSWSNVDRLPIHGIESSLRDVAEVAIGKGIVHFWRLCPVGPFGLVVRWQRVLPGSLLSIFTPSFWYSGSVSEGVQRVEVAKERNMMCPIVGNLDRAVHKVSDR